MGSTIPNNYSKSLGALGHCSFYVFGYQRDEYQCQQQQQHQQHQVFGSLVISCFLTHLQSGQPLSSVVKHPSTLTQQLSHAKENKWAVEPKKIWWDSIVLVGYVIMPSCLLQSADFLRTRLRNLSFATVKISILANTWRAVARIYPRREGLLQLEGKALQRQKIFRWSKPYDVPLRQNLGNGYYPGYNPVLTVA